jgi:hypothetical protein
MTHHHEPVFSPSEEKPITAYLLATPQLLHGRFNQTYERILGALLTSDSTKLTPGELEALGDKGKVFFGDGITPIKSKNKRSRGRKGAKQEVAAAVADVGTNENQASLAVGEEGAVNGSESIEELDYEQMHGDQSRNTGNEATQYTDPRKLDRNLSIYVKGIDDSMTAEGLKDAFCTFGVVNAVDVVYNRQCAYIEFNSKEDCERAIDTHEIMIGDVKVYAQARRFWNKPRGFYRGGRSGYSARSGYGEYQTGGFRGGYMPRSGYRGRGGYRGGYRGRDKGGEGENGNGEIDSNQQEANQQGDNQQGDNQQGGNQQGGNQQGGDHVEISRHEGNHHEGNQHGVELPQGNDDQETSYREA